MSNNMSGINLTPKAEEQLRKFLGNYLGYHAVRLGVRGGGCTGLEYSIGLITQPEPDWELYKFLGVDVYIDPMSMMYLDGTTVDYVESLQESGFKFNNPQVKSTCGCGQSFSV